jgi:hypothetical protein
VASGIGLLILHPIFSAMFRRDSPEAYGRLAQPTWSYFATGEFFGFGPFARWLITLGPVRENQLSKTTKWLGVLESLLFMMLCFAWTTGLLVWIFDR